MRHDSTGIAATEQVGQSKVVNIGKVLRENVGNVKQVTIGDELEIVVGKSTLVMRSDGSVFIKGTSLSCDFSDHIQLNSKLIDLN
ncbi:hypothetical protein QR78_27440, partial [Methylobacterium indicum]|uniref:Uncharacterized protein n=1 Tax=Methylobacterium indicum TaxID=1775910 RepID=A0ABR5HD03_9HYPH